MRSWEINEAFRLASGYPPALVNCESKNCLPDSKICRALARSFIVRAIDNVKEHAMIGGILVILIIFVFLRDFRATLTTLEGLQVVHKVESWLRVEQFDQVLGR